MKNFVELLGEFHPLINSVTRKFFISRPRINIQVDVLHRIFSETVFAHNIPHIIALKSVSVLVKHDAIKIRKWKLLPRQCRLNSYAITKLIKTDRLNVLAPNIVL